MNSALRLRSMVSVRVLRRRCGTMATLSQRLTSSAPVAASRQSIVSRLVQPSSRRQLHSSVVLYKDYPVHQFLPMPALSPTMEMGTIAKWEVKEGDEFTAGSVLCSVETDKATMDFELQDDGFIAKILCDGPNMVDIPVGRPICIVVEEEEDVAAFADFVLDSEPAAAAAESSEPAAPAASAPATTTTAAESSSLRSEHALLPSARFLAESKYVFENAIYRKKRNFFWIQSLTVFILFFPVRAEV